MNADELRELIGTKPFKPLEIATQTGDHFLVEQERDVYNNPRRPELFVLFTQDGLLHLIDADQIVSASLL